MSIKEDADKHRLLQAAALLKLYKQAHGGAGANSLQDLDEWVNAGANPYNVLSDEEIVETLKTYLEPFTVPIAFNLQPDTELIENICENNRNSTEIAGK
jgi:hypothetical protein